MPPEIDNTTLLILEVAAGLIAIVVACHVWLRRKGLTAEADYLAKATEPEREAYWREQFPDAPHYDD